jgi:large repetitive protein
LILFVAACGDAVPNHQPEVAAVTPVAVDDRGVPRLLHARPSGPVAGTATEAARVHLGRIAHAYGVAATALPELEAAGEIAVRGGTVARLRQRIAGIPVEGGELRVLVRGDGELVTTSGTLISADTPRTPARFAPDVSDEAGAIARAVSHTHKVQFDRTALGMRGTLRGGAFAGIEVDLARAQQVWVPRGDRLVAAWLVEAYTSKVGSTNDEAWRTVLAHDGRVLEHRSLVADAEFHYRVFAEATGDKRPEDGPIADFTPHPAGVPNGTYPAYTLPSLVAVDGLNRKGVGAPDPWLPAGATETRGNNVDAYADFNPPNGLTAGDFRASITSPGVFDRSYDTAAQPLASQDQQMAAIVSLFYAINWLHDFWYDAGFTEAAGNAQASNYGRGGIEGDAMRAEAQDNALGGSRNNANMATPSDGIPPRMQVFLWSGKEERSLQVANLTPATNTASFGPRSFDITAQVVLADDGTDVATDACSALLGDVAGKIVLVDRGGCTFKSKAARVQQAGGVGMILADNQASGTPPTMGNDSQTTATITIGSLSVTMAQGALIRANLPATGRLHRLAGVELDGSLDATLVAHEFGHYLHHRLQSCGTRMCSALSEGWGDFTALMLLAREGDELTGAYPFSVYTTQTFSRDPAYFGIRRAPYSVNPSINALSFRHMADNEPLPTSHPFLAFGNNAEVHNAGEIWASALWEGYVALQQAGRAAGQSFAEVRQKMAEYVVTGLLLAPADGTPTETRDAILAAAQAASPADHDVLVAGFARRGLGSCAESPPRTSGNFVGIVESSEVRGRALPGIPTIADSVESCDQDGVLDAGETARITLPIINPGHGTVTDVTVAVTSSTPGVRVVSGPVTLGTLAPYTTTEVEIDISLDAATTGAIDGTISLEVSASAACQATATTPIKVRLNVDEIPASSATDTFDAAATLWTTETDSDPGWARVAQTALDTMWHGADLGTRADTSLISPELTAEDAQPLVVTFTHRYLFEHSDGTAFDGGVIEVSTDGGATWADVLDLGVDPGYGEILTSDSGNPLGGRLAFTGESSGYPSTTTARLDFGTQLAGKTFQLRFRIGTDQAVGGDGWEIDDVAFEGIVGTPFTTVVPQDSACEPTQPEPPGDGGGGCCGAGPLGADTGLLALGVLGLLGGRRRRTRNS